MRRTISARLREVIAIFVHNFRPSAYLKGYVKLCRMNPVKEGAHRSYAVDVLKEMTKPTTVPSTVSIWFEIASECDVSSDTSVTTASRPIRLDQL